MRKFIGIIVAFMLTVGFAVADEAVLFDSTAKADVLGTGYDWVSNSKAVAVSGCYRAGVNLQNPVLNDKYGLMIRTDSAPEGDSNYAFGFVAPNFNEPNTGSGYIKNAAAIKSMDITMTLNRGYDEVTIYWVQNGVEHHMKFPADSATSQIESMKEFTAHIDFVDYIKDVRNRSVKQFPVAGLNLTNIYLTRIQVTTHRAVGDWYFSPVSIVGIKKISVIYDKAVTDESYELGKEADEIFDVHPNATLEARTKRKIESDMRQTEYNKSLMATEGTESSQTSASSDAK